MELRNKTCLVTGGSGNIGSYITAALLREGARVVSLDIRETKLEGVESVSGDIRNLEQTRRAFEGWNIDVLFHQAGQVDIPYSVKEPASDFAINAGGTLNLLLLARDYQVERFTFASSAAVYGKLQYSPVDEQHPTNPVNPYGASKLAAEKYVQAFNSTYGLSTTSLRYFNVYSSKVDQNRLVIATLLDCLLHNRRPKLYAGGEQERDFVHMEDIARANILAAKSDASVGETFNIGTGKPTKVNELYQILKELFGSNLEPLYEEGASELYPFVADISKAKELLGYSPTIDLQQGLERLVKDTKL